MPVYVTGIMKHKNGKDPVAEAEDIKMPDGSRLSDFRPAMPVLPGTDRLEPEKVYLFAEPVTELSVTLVQKGDNAAHEYWFQFVPDADFSGLTITPAPVWQCEEEYPAGKTVRVGVMMGMAVMGIA